MQNIELNEKTIERLDKLDLRTEKLPNKDNQFNYSQKIDFLIDALNNNITGVSDKHINILKMAVKEEIGKMLLPPKIVLDNISVYSKVMTKERGHGIVLKNVNNGQGYVVLLDQAWPDIQRPLCIDHEDKIPDFPGRLTWFEREEIELIN